MPDKPQAASRSLRVAFLIPRFHTNLYFATRGLVETGHQVHLICTNKANLEDHTYVVPHYLEESSSLAEVWLLLQSLSPDLLFIRDVPGLSRKFLLAGSAQRRRLFAYDQHPVSRPRSLRKYFTDLLRGRPVRRITPVPGLQRPPKPSRLSHYLPFPAAPVGHPPIRADVSTETVRILCVGKLAQPRKNQSLLIEALAGIGSNPNFTLTLVGSTDLGASGGSADYLAKLRDHVQRGPLAGRLTIHEDVAFDAMPPLYASHDICVLPSIGEPLGTAPLEAMSYGCVPVISNQCGSAGYVSSDAVGSIVAGGDLTSLRNALSELLTIPRARLQEMGRNAQELAATEFSIETFVRRVEALAEL